MANAHETVVSLEATQQKEYESIEAAVMETARGRWFLAEHARRARGSETTGLLAAIDTLRKLIEAQRRPTQAVSGLATARFTPSLRPSDIRLAASTSAGAFKARVTGSNPLDASAVHPLHRDVQISQSGLVGDERDTIDYRLFDQVA